VRFGLVIPDFRRKNLYGLSW